MGKIYRILSIFYRFFLFFFFFLDIIWRCLKHEVTLFYTGTFIGEVRPQSIDRLVDEYVWDIDEYMDMDINNKIANPTDAKLATMV